MTCGLVHASYSLSEWQALKLTFFAPCKLYVSNYHSVSFHLLHFKLVSCNDAASYKCNNMGYCKILNSDQNVLHFFSHIQVWNCEAKIFLTFYYYFIHWIHMGHGKPGKLCNLRISFSKPGKSWNLIFGHGKSWKVMETLTSVWYRYIESLQMSQHGESISMNGVRFGGHHNLCLLNWVR